jgi:hypothetical protein
MVQGLASSSGRGTTIGAIGVGDRQRQSSFGLAHAGPFFDNVVGHSTGASGEVPTETALVDPLKFRLQVKWRSPSDKYQLLD